jgi:hypothetical protein
VLTRWKAERRDHTPLSTPRGTPAPRNQPVPTLTRPVVRRRPLGFDCGVRVFADGLVDWSRLTSETHQTIVGAARTLARSPSRSVGQAFRYACFFAPEDPRASAWLLVFYDKITFLAITAPDERQPSRTRSAPVPPTNC